MALMFKLLVREAVYYNSNVELEGHLSVPFVIYCTSTGSHRAILPS